MCRSPLVYASIVVLAALMSACGQQEPVAPPTPQTTDKSLSGDPQPAVNSFPPRMGEGNQAPAEPPPVAPEVAEILEAPEPSSEAPAEAPPTTEDDVPSEADTSAMEELIHAESVDEAPEPDNLPEGDWIEEVPVDDSTEEIYQDEGVPGEETVDGGILEDGTSPDVIVEEPAEDEEEDVPPDAEVPPGGEVEEEIEPAVIE